MNRRQRKKLIKKLLKDSEARVNYFFSMNPKYIKEATESVTLESVLKDVKSLYK